MSDHCKATEAKRLSADSAGTVAIEYALIAAMVVFAIVMVLRGIGSRAMFGLPPIIKALQMAIAP